MRPRGGITPGADCRLRHIKDCWNVWQCLPEEDRDIDNLATFTGLTHQKLRTDYLPMIHSMEKLIKKGVDVQLLLDRKDDQPETSEEMKAAIAFDKQLAKDVKALGKPVKVEDPAKELSDEPYEPVKKNYRRSKK